MEPTTVGRRAGPAAVVLALGGTLAAVAVSPAFSFAGNALSELGVADTAVGTSTTATLFNGGLVLGGIVGLAFAWYLVTVALDAPGRLVGVCFGGTTWAMAGVGVFPMGHPLHAPAALAFFLGITATLAGSGLAARRRGERGVAPLAGAVAHVLGWIVWLAAGGPDRLGIAVPELWGALLLSAWVVLAARRPAGYRS